MAGSTFGLISLLLWLVAIALVGAVAHAKGRNRFGWGLAALFFGPIVLVLVVVVPRLKPPANRGRFA
jgi:hypothetical protein